MAAAAAIPSVVCVGEPAILGGGLPHVTLRLARPSGELALELRASPSARVEELVAALEEPTATPAAFQRLVFEGRELGLGRRVAEEGLRDGSWITLVRLKPQEASLLDARDACHARYLLECRAEAGAADADGQTPLHCAVARGLASVSLALLAPGVDPKVNVADVVGRTALHVSACVGLLPVVRAILGRDDFTAVNAEDCLGHTALHIACLEGFADIGEAIVELEDFRGIHEALDIAQEVDSGEICRGLLASCHRTALAERDGSGRTVLHWAIEAIKEGMGQACKALLARGDFAELDAQDGAGRTALVLAADCGHESACRAVLAQEGFTAINVGDRRGRTALIAAVQAEMPAVGRAILARENFTAVNAQDERGRTGLDYAVEKDLADVCKAVVARPTFAAVNAPLPDGGTLLHWAAARGHLPVCEAVLSRKDFVAAGERDRQGRTALHRAAAACSLPACLAILCHLDPWAVDAEDAEGRTAFGIVAALQTRSVNTRAAICEAILARRGGGAVDLDASSKAASQPLYRGQAKLERLTCRYRRELATGRREAAAAPFSIGVLSPEGYVPLEPGPRRPARLDREP